MTDRGRDRESIRSVGERRTRGAARPGSPTSGHSQPVDAGRTTGGGSLGHDQPEHVRRQGEIRSPAEGREKMGPQHEPPEPLPELEP